MSDAFTQAGAVRGGSRYAAATMGGEQFTGLWTQRSPYRDAATAYLIKKFYAGSRFDSIIDGLNREIGANLTDVRSPGSSVWNAQTFPAINSFYPWEYVQNNAQIIRTIVDGADGNIYDATAGGKINLFAKTAGAGVARFLGVNTEMFFGDGVDTKKVLRSGLVWMANTVYGTGNFIIDPNGNVQEVCYVKTNTQTQVAIQTVQVSSIGNATFGLAVPDPFVQQTSIVPSGLTTHTVLNGVTLLAAVPNLINTVQGSGAPGGTYGPAADTGVLNGFIFQGNGTETSGATQPTWPTVWGNTVVDNDLVWRCLGSPIQNWGLNMPLPGVGSVSGYRPGPGGRGGGPITSTSATVTVTPLNTNQFWWIAAKVFATSQAVLDSNGQYEVWQGTGGAKTGATQPIWSTALGGVTIDGGGSWLNCGTASTWLPLFQYPDVLTSLVDTNGNLQISQNYFTTETIWVTGVANTQGNANLTGATEPTWNTTLGGTTTDGAYTWTCCGPGTILRSGTVQYAFCYRAVDGTVSNASLVNATIVNGVLGIPGQYAIGLQGPGPNDLQCDQIWIERTANGEPTLLFLDAVLNPNNIWAYQDVLPDSALVVELPAPINLAGSVPPVGARPMCFAFQRTWYAVQNMLYYTAGPDAVAIGANGNTACPPLNFIPFLGTVYAVRPITVQNGGLLVFTSAGIQIVLGNGTAGNKFYASTYYGLVNVAGYNAVSDLVGTTVFTMESNGKVSAIQIEYPFNPASGYTEVGFPIGDQFNQVTTGGVNAALFDPSTACVTWNNQSTSENALYVADAATGWFRMSAISPPESGFMWGCLRQIAGGSSAVQSIQTVPAAPGTRARTQLLIGPPAGTPGPILTRDNTRTVYTDNGAAYPAYDTKGVMLLCSTGQWSDVAHISAKSAAVGARPTVSVLLNEIVAVPAKGAAYSVLEVTGDDPQRGKKSVSVFSDRYDLAQNNVEMEGDALLVKFDYGTQAVGDALLDFGIYASVHDEREEAVAK